MERKVILSLFDYTGNWCRPYRDNGYTVMQIDIKHGVDILTWDYKSLKNVYGILAAVPCTDYAVSGARWFKSKDEDGRTAQSQLLVKKTMEIINYFKPEFWVIENPVSRIGRLNPGIGEVKQRFNPYDFAYLLENPLIEQYSKKTCLWGKFNQLIKNALPCLDYEKIHRPTNKEGVQVGWNTEECKELRQETPEGFAKAFYQANK